MTEKNTKIRVVPHSKDSEMMVLGCMLTSVNSLNVAADMLDESDFYFNEHKEVFRVLQFAYKQDKPADVHLVVEELKRAGRLEAIGGASYIATLAQYAGTSAYTEQYAEIVKAKSILRKMIHAAQSIEKEALADPQDVHGTLDEAQKLFFQISQSANPGSGYLLSDLLSGIRTTAKLPFIQELQERQEAHRNRGSDLPSITGIPSHFLDLDRMINGLNNSNLMILAARPAMGKTAFAINIAANICFENKMPVGIFSLEMTAEQLLHRLICSHAEVESDKITRGTLSGAEFQRIVASVGEMQKHTMVIDDQPGLKITDLRARARRMKESYGIRLLVIDYLQLITGSGNGRTAENRQNEISEISRMLKTLARELDIPVLCLSQLSRKVEDRPGHRPQMSDLRESGCLSGDTLIQDAINGKFYTIKELAERKEQFPIYVNAVDKKFKINKHKMIKAFYSGKKEVFELKTRTGRSIKASANHPFLKLNGWTSLDQLMPGDHIAIPDKISIESSYNGSSDEWAFLAHLLGDGCILPRQPYHYTNADEENLKIVADLSHNLFGIIPKRVDQNGWSHIYFPSPYKLTRGCYHPITNWFNKLEIKRVRSYEKCLPAFLFQESEKEIAHFLHHIWATDGNISEKKLKNRKPSAAIYYSSSSKILSKQIQHLLLRLGIHSTLSMVQQKQHRPNYHLHILGAKNQIKFLTLVGSHGKRGKEGIKLLESLKQIAPNPNKGTIPKEAWQLFITPAKERAKLSWRDICQHMGMSYCGSTLFQSGISRERLQKICSFLKDDRLADLAESDVYWDEIKSITKLGFEDVYDATVEDVHNFVANDIIVHNSIEQDSDVVMFLLRREYYDPNDKPGMAELMVSKNRHGAVGNIMLTFVKELAQFKNYTPIHVQVDEEMFV